MSLSGIFSADLAVAATEEVFPDAGETGAAVLPFAISVCLPFSLALVLALAAVVVPTLPADPDPVPGSLTIFHLTNSSAICASSADE